MTYKKLKVDYTTPIKDQLKELGITCYLDLNNLEHLYSPSSNGFIYDIENGKEMVGKSPKECEELFKSQNRRGLTIYEGLALFRKNPKVLKDHYIDLIGSRYDSDNVPSLWLSAARPSFYWHYRDDACSSWGAASCGSKDRTLNLGSLASRVLALEQDMDKIKKFLII